MKTYLLVDAMNCIMRCRHVVRADTPEDKAAMALHVNFMSMRKVWKKFQANHLVVALEGKSWRKEVYPRYKANRVVDEASVTPEEKKEEESFWEAYSEFVELLDVNSNATVLRHPLGEADDMIARWIATHPDDNHIIFSSDSDFIQLVNDKVTLFNGITGMTITPKGVFDQRDRPVDFFVKNDGKLSIKKTILKSSDPFPEREDWIEYALFTKVMRGDKGDNIFTACKPGTRQKGSSKTSGIVECFENRHDQGYEWFNFMNQRWTDHNGKENIVREKFEENSMLINLTAMPEEVKDAFDQYILEYEKPAATQLGFHFLRFANKYGLEDIKNNPKDFVEMLNEQR